MPRVAGLYVAGSSLGGFCGRFIPGVLADVVGWRAAFRRGRLLTSSPPSIVAALLPRERQFVRSGGFGASALQMLRHLGNPALVATYAVGFGVLFNFIAIFTYVSFHLAAPPYDFSPAALGALFLTYLVSGPCRAAGLVAPCCMFGRRRFMLAVIAVWVVGALFLLAPPVAVIVIGLSLCAGCGMLCQAISTGYVTASAPEGRSSAIGLYVSSFYFGGSVGGYLAGIVWSHAGWSAVVALCAAVLAGISIIVGDMCLDIASAAKVARISVREALRPPSPGCPRERFQPFRRATLSSGNTRCIPASKIRLVRGGYAGVPSGERQLLPVFRTDDFAPGFDPAPVGDGRRPRHREDAVILDREPQLQMLATIAVVGCRARIGAARGAQVFPGVAVQPSFAAW